MTKLVIIGTGMAGYTLAREFRRRNEEVELVLITRDDGNSYSKPMLSNALSKNKNADELVVATPEKMTTNLNKLEKRGDGVLVWICKIAHFQY